MSHNTDNPIGRVDNDQLSTIKRLATIALVLAVAISGVVIASGAVAAHPGHSEETDDDPGKYMGPDYEHGVEDHGWYPAHGVQEGQLSDGYGGYYGGR